MYWYMCQNIFQTIRSKKVIMFSFTRSQSQSWLRIKNSQSQSRSLPKTGGLRNPAHHTTINPFPTHLTTYKYSNNNKFLPDIFVSQVLFTIIIYQEGEQVPTYRHELRNKVSRVIQGSSFQTSRIIQRSQFQTRRGTKKSYQDHYIFLF